MPDGEGQYLAFADAAWARLRSSDRGRLRAAEGPDDMWDVGDVILVKAVEKDGAFDHWSYRQIPAIQGGFMAMDTQTGRVLAMQGGFSYQSSVFNRATQALRQPGSSFKPFVYAAALDSGYSPATIVLDAPIEVATGAGIWKPENAGNTYYGPTPMRTGIEQSRNLMTVRIAQDVGMDTVAKYGERFGIYDKMPHLLSYSLGAGETTLYKMVTAYAELANGGLKVEPTLVDRVQDRYGKTIYRHDQRACEGCAADDIASRDAAARAFQRRAGDGRDHRLPGHLDAAGRGRPRHQRRLGRPARPQPRRQDRHHQRGQGRLVHRLLARASSPAATWATTRRARSAKAPSAARSARRSSSSSSRRRWRGRARSPSRCRRAATSSRSTATPASGSPTSPSGANVQAEYIRDGQELMVGAFGDTVDAGWKMGADVPLYESVRNSPAIERVMVRGQSKALPANPTLGTLSSGGLY